MRYRTTPWLFLTPFLLAFTAFFIAPVGYAVYLSLFIKKRSGFGPAKSVFGGLENYVRAFQDTAFLQSLGNILLFLAIQVPIMLIVATAMALILDSVKSGAAQKFFRTAFYLPYTVPGVIAGLLWGYLYSKNLSPLNQITGWKTDFLSSSILLFSIGNIVTWTWTGYNMITLYAALQNVPGDIYEAARIDGASNWSLTRYIKLPLLRPALTLTAIFSIIGTMQIFSEPFVLRPLGYVPDNITPNTYLYLAVARDGNFGYGAALAIIMALFTLVFSSFFLRNVRGESS
ncbi:MULTISPECIES: carbohydrate ABC transporter permease [Deinococcus]|uniref:ABC-type sugar transport systempermease component n=1 Tax=Deinococcus marmoris TaxID=249408 RepID=A0A1U7NX81_9DEIO|nr:MULTISPECIES: sugar ABC transporter permease [Deinococcus]OLV17538.1 ABC-type sugar transport systempermease component [Deinococcus marmoris]QFP77823.1 sugar ABC transporter permease [Deinococcus sp. AJ005]